MNIKRNKKVFSMFMALAMFLSILTPSFVVVAEDTGAESFVPEVGSLLITKYQQEAGDSEGRLPLEGVTYEVIQTHSFDGINWTPVDGSPQTYTETTDEKGEINIQDMVLGRYTVQEIDGPDSVILNTNKFSVDIPMTTSDGKDVIYDVEIYPKNEIVRGDAELIKKNESGQVLEGIKFGLFKKNGEAVQEDGKDVVLTTDGEGKIGFEGLVAGEYYFQELETIPGYALNNTEIHFEVKKDKDGDEGKTVVEWATVEGFVATDENGNVLVTNYDRPEVEKDVEDKMQLDIDRDEEYKYNITLTTPGDIEDYKSLGVTDTLDNRLDFITDGSIQGGWDVTGTPKDNIKFTQDGQTLKWSVKDLTALSPNSEIKITFTAKIKADAELVGEETGIPNKVEINFDNDRGQEDDPKEDNPDEPTRVTPKEGGLQIIKVDKSDNNIKLANAEFKLTTDKQGSNIVDATGTIIKVNGKAHTGKLENLTTNDAGEVIITGLKTGTYFLHETKAPTYIDKDGVENSYRILTKPLEVVVGNSEINEAVTVENSKSGWDLPVTGGIGTILFTVIGLALMAASFYVLKKYKEEPEM